MLVNNIKYFHKNERNGKKLFCMRIEEETLRMGSKDEPNIVAGRPSRSSVLKNYSFRLVR